MSYFFSLYYRKIIKVICAILAVVIDDMKVHLSNLNLLFGKNAIGFKPLAKKKETGKQTASAQYYKY